MFNPANLSLEALLLYLKNSEAYQDMQVIADQRKLVIKYLQGKTV